MRNRKRGILILAVLLLAAALTGCRVRTVADPALADVVRRVEAEEPERSETRELPPEPEPETPPEPEETPAETAEESHPDEVTSLSETGAPQLRAAAAAGITVTYDPNGGDTEKVRTVVAFGGTYGPQPEARRRGYGLTGWWTAPSGGSRVRPDTPVEREDAHTLYAQWEEKATLTVIFDGNGGRVKSRQARMELSPGDPYGPLPVPLREGYAFLGWSAAPDGGETVEEGDLFAGTEDLILYALWQYEPLEFWSFTLCNRAQQVYLCQQAAVYFETAVDGVTRGDCPLITDTGSENIAQGREDPTVTDGWVLERNPRAVVKEVESLEHAAAVRRALAVRFPGKQVVLVTAEALGDGPDALYAKLALAKELYGDWYSDVDLSAAARELGVAQSPIEF